MKEELKRKTKRWYYRFRDAINGKFLSKEEFERRHPSTTMQERRERKGARP